MFLSCFYFSVVFVCFCVFLKNNIYLTNVHNVHALSVTRKQKKEATTAFISMLRETCFTITEFCDFTFTQHYKKIKTKFTDQIHQHYVQKIGLCKMAL